ncbi:FadR/GntR family transcriptional regulator [Succinatimonas hippei]|uniref:FadR/GntR family transcriptional regulator n=1 Tax=Succinatimonas hippei TaxID=626938 RepID=UPI0030B87955
MQKMTTSKTANLIEIIGKNIVKGNFKEGDIFESEHSLCEEFSVSRGVIREVLQRLSEKGLIEKRMHSCWRVCSKEEWNIFDDDLIDWCFEDRQNQDLYLQFLEFRKEIEPKAIVLATIRANDKDLDNLRCSLNMMQASVDNQDKFAVADSFFHQYLFKATHNNVYAKIGKSISRLLKYSVSRTYRRNEQDMNDTLNTHKEILRAIENRDALLASELVLKVIFRAIELINKGN